MAIFAQLNSDNVVVLLTFVPDEIILDKEGKENENLGIKYCKKKFNENANWKLTSNDKNNTILGEHLYALLGSEYIENLNIFRYPKPYSSWKLSEDELNWVPPIGAAPFLTQEQQNSGLACMWNEDLHQVDNNSGWEIVSIKDAFPRSHTFK